MNTQTLNNSLSRRLTAVAASAVMAFGGVTIAQAAEGSSETLQQSFVAADSVAQDIQARTANHLEQLGHHRDAAADVIAERWAEQAAAGELEFETNIAHGQGNGINGTGHVLRLTESAAEQRLADLERETVPTEDGKAFGVAVASDDEYVYVAEFFLNDES